MANSLDSAAPVSKGLVELILSAPEASEMLRATEHLRYWPYVKEYHMLDESHVSVVVCLGVMPSCKKWHHYYKRSLELISLCLRRYGVQVCGSGCALPAFAPVYRPDAFLRPDSLLIGFRRIIDDVDETSVTDKIRSSKL